ncbi:MULTISPECIES: type 1 glutamine amidotransferase domain-containing protein [unclassified Methylophaga]|jgi:protease I|uniref:type 1 glutamine amidotransferase domain-containing protein n=1 Tax=unclassified Methylophaga TaxID=2629249 RepID=UPI00259C8E1B|nr:MULTISPECIES: type 1 glutamine amidotransferase domain-containing protein [unclassified Methylophaga]|tara:strand:- start:979 stop:1536 length:558 start_codon:yes stop_codon:yes gene_type:complete
MQNSTTTLQGKKIAFLVTDGFEQIELTTPWEQIKLAGADSELIALKAGKVQGYNHLDKADAFGVDKAISEVSASDYDGLVLPGGVANPDALRTDSNVVNFIRDFFSQHKPVAAICHAPWTLVEADILKGKMLTSWPSLKTDIQNAGGTWLNEEVVVDNGLVTSRKPDDLDAFCSKAIEEFAEGKH